MAEDVQLEWVVRIEKAKNGTVTVVAPEIDATVVRQILIDAFISINQDICVNKALVLLDAYMSNVAVQKKILATVGPIGGEKSN
jgi:hypothetical protein